MSDEKSISAKISLFEKLANKETSDQETGKSKFLEKSKIS